MTKGLLKIIGTCKANNIPQEYIDFLIEKKCKINDAKGIAEILIKTDKSGDIASLDYISRLYELCYHTRCDLIMIYNAFGFDLSNIEKFIQLYQQYVYIPDMLKAKLTDKIIKIEKEHNKIGKERVPYSNWLKEHYLEDDAEEYQNIENIEGDMTSKMMSLYHDSYRLYAYQRAVYLHYFTFIEDVVNYDIDNDIIDYIMKQEESLRLYKYQVKRGYSDSYITNMGCSNFRYIHFQGLSERGEYNQLLFKDLKDNKMQSLVIRLLENNLLLQDNFVSPEIVINYFIQHPEKAIGKNTAITISDDEYIKIIQENNLFFKITEDFLNKHNQKMEWINGRIISSLTEENPSIQKVVDLDLKCYTVIELPYYEISFDLHRNGYINISISNYSSTVISYSEGSTGEENNTPHYHIYGLDKNYDIYKLTITPDGKLYDGHRNIKPLSLKKMYRFLKNPFFKEFMEIFAGYKDLPLWNDIIKDCQEINNCFIPVMFNDLYKYGNKSDLLKDTYKNADSLRINYNKVNINLSYMIIKTKSFITNDSIGILQNIRDISLVRDNFVPFVSGKKIKYPVAKFIANYFYSKGYKHEHELSDYFRWCLGDNRKINLNHSEARLLEEHDHYLVNADYDEIYKKTSNIKIPQKSRFDIIYKYMPAEFERIKTRKRIASEAAVQSNCVWTYADYINKDVCCVFSFYDKDALYDNESKRYTIEIQRNEAGFWAKQVKSSHNREGSKKIHEYINNLLDELNKKYILL